MLGFGKNNKNESTAAVSPEPVAAVPALSEDKFVVMPGEYRAAPSAASASINKKWILLAGGSAAVLALFSIGLYFLLAGNEAPAPEVAALPEADNSSESGIAPASSEEAAEETNEEIISAQAYNKTGVLLGTLSMSVPTAVAEEFGNGIGVTVIDPADAVLPEDTGVFGGVYSLYPVAQTFSQPVSFSIMVADYGEDNLAVTLAPAYLRGTVWQEIPTDPAEGSSEGFKFTLEKFPSGLVAIIGRAAAMASTSPESYSAEPPSVVASPDTDTDGLTDKEELLLGTSISAPDTDGDTYLDKSEIESGYSPSRIGEKLGAGELFGTYTNSTYGYQVAYPAAWLADSLDQTNKQVLFISDTEEFFEILIQDNPLNTPILDWYKALSPSFATSTPAVTILNGKPAVWSKDGLTLYTAKDGLIYIITYNNGMSDTVSWPYIFKRFYSSFIFGNTTTAATVPTTAGTSAGGL